MSIAEKSVKHGGSACQRCRRRKQKCDQRHPQCSGCESANVPCLTYHSGKQANIPRGYVTDLEKQVAELTKEIQELRQRAQYPGTGADDPTIATASTSEYSTSLLQAQEQPVFDESSPVLQGLVTSVQNVVVQPSHQPRFLGQSSGITFAKLVMASVHMDRPSSLTTLQQPIFQETSVSSTTKASLPPRHVADHLINVYFQYRTPHLPILDRSQVIKAIDSAYASLKDDSASDLVPENDMFVAYMVFAIALVDVPHTSGSRSSQSDDCFRSALVWVEKILTYSMSDLESLRIVLLLAQFVALSPAQGSLWHLTGFALRLCVESGLHWENELQCLSMDPDILNDRRRLWHTTYFFDRLLCITLGRPFGIVDDHVRVQIPNPWTASRSGLDQRLHDYDIHTQRAQNHIFNLAKIESEIRHVQTSQGNDLRLASPRPSWTLWLRDVQPRLQEWLATIPDRSKAHPASIFASEAYWDVIYHNALLLLYRPHSNTAYQSTEDLFVSFEASSRVIAGLKILQREGRCEMLWKSVHHLFMAGLGIIYGLWRSKEIRDRNPVSQSISILQSCAMTISAMSETFKGAAGCRNAFESLSSATIDWLITKDIEEVHANRLEFESQVRELMKELRSARGDVAAQHAYAEPENFSAMFTAENFDLSELLNAAAQWPDEGELDSLQTTGIV